MADMEAAPAQTQTNAAAKLGFAALVLAFGAGSAWLWAQYGSVVYLTRLADFAMTCF